MPRQLLMFALILACNATDVFAQDTCNYLPKFKVLRKQLDTLPPATAIAKLQEYLRQSDNPDSCEFSEADDLITERERKLIKLQMDGKELTPQLVSRCNQFNKKTARCLSPMADDTVFYLDYALNVKAFAMPTSGTRYQIVSALASANLTALYQIDLYSEGKGIRRLDSASANRWHATNQTSALIGIFKTRDMWRYRKVVWYFNDMRGAANVSNQTD